jgi:hypothetical protein
LEAGTRIRSERANTPEVSLQYATYLTGARLTRLTATLAGGELRDWTRINQQEAASFAAFGEVDTGQAALTLHFSGVLADTEPAEHRLSLGVSIADSVPSEPSATLQGVEVSLHAQRRRQALPVVLDTTGGLLRSGVLLLDLSAVDPGVRDFTITLRSRGGDFARAPRLVRTQRAARRRPPGSAGRSSALGHGAAGSKLHARAAGLAVWPRYGRTRRTDHCRR